MLASLPFPTVCCVIDHSEAWGFHRFSRVRKKVPNLGQAPRKVGASPGLETVAKADRSWRTTLWPSARFKALRQSVGPNTHGEVTAIGLHMHMNELAALGVCIGGQRRVGIVLGAGGLIFVQGIQGLK